jgi:hypothetical protein
MGQVTIYVEDSALQAARKAATHAQISLSQWFAQFAADEKKRQSVDWCAFFTEIDAMTAPGDDDFPDPGSPRGGDVSDLPDLPLERW